MECKTYFTCPHCETASYTKEQMEIGVKINYCYKCGEEIKESYEAALNNERSEYLKEHTLCIGCGTVKIAGDNYCTKCGKNWHQILMPERD